MDFVAIQQATDEDLGSLGLLKRGDILALRSFIDQKTAHPQLCEERVQKKKKLLQLATFDTILAESGNFSLAQYKYIQICKLCEAIFSMFYNISPPNLPIPLILGCSF